MKYIALIALSMVSTINSMFPANKKRQKEATNIAKHYMERAKWLVPERYISQLHPNLKQQVLEYNQEIAENQAKRQRQMWPEQYKKR